MASTINYIPVKSIGRIRFIAIEDIVWIKGAANYVEIHLQDSMVLHRETLTSLAEKLGDEQFVRVHRSAIVNIDHLHEISSELGRYSLVELKNGQEIRIGNAYRRDLFQSLGLEQAS
ncbi:LytR/AlgR family response regulator transcription factor [Pseudidiomarina terrestris]|uniref:LytTR family transcriptional regulator n=1 Tax=Pseudidiomarina terrestris TaxID=2820060 RepID=A0AAW7R0W9_9GAMM|nr:MULTISPECIES: LytTR family DNA-binding domain-containing protein [unclassified Pseudidiomarina]MDN7124592.1 LytTR family transcriptional regulator [Pseudidiomarina sp. 1APP75-32.1]MDN7126862.1 LytTR family transcriptional regulator [Pseudidiomarina sp. 1APR75-33.1]MDN7129117.1 LytTR family transcriptional regulator [Pseudidiomarina sp. 1APR75-15]MDN7134619.1 LytTR family transcriptional regulator [Pseudidiomarina sp. 1ASP75-5]MDN7136711.1 LytTR family transcriptional regulator [Pseudidiomar